MLKIGVFAGLAQVSIKCLRHYDDIGLLRPVEVDQRSGYRYYAVDQLPRLHRILALKEMGFSLEEITRLIDASLSTEQLKHMLKSHQSETERRLREEQERLTRIEAHLRLLENPDEAPLYDVMLKNVPSQLVASAQATFDMGQNLFHPIVDLMAEARSYLRRENMPAAGPEFTLWRPSKNGDSVYVEAVFPLSTPLAPTSRVQVYELPGQAMASAVHRGRLGKSWQAMVATVRWAEENGYRITGASRSIYHLCDKSQERDSVVEVQIPVVKVGPKRAKARKKS